MKNKKWKTLSITALIISVLPLTTLIPALLKTTLPEGVRTIWAGANIIFVLLGLFLSIFCVRNKENRSAINIISTAVSILWLLIMVGVGILVLFINFPALYNFL